MANSNQPLPVPPEPIPVPIQSIEDIIKYLQLKVSGLKSSNDESVITYSCIPDPDQNIPECDKMKILDPGPVHAQSMMILNKCSGSSRWTGFTKQRLSEPRGATNKWKAVVIDKDSYGFTIIKRRLSMSSSRRLSSVLAL